jgi:predicted Zn-dependent peptidase
LKSFEAAIGILDEFMACTPQELQAFYDMYYVPHNISLVCIGPIAKQTLLQMVQETPFAIAKPGHRRSIPIAYLPHPPRKHEQHIHMAEFFTLTQKKATCTFEWVVPLHFPRQCLSIFSNLLETILTEELRYQRSLTYDVDVHYEYYQDCRTLQIQFEISPHVIEMAKDLVWQVIRSIYQFQEKFLETKNEQLHCIYRMDYSGYDLLQAVITDLKHHHCLIPFSEELKQVEQITFEQIVELAEYLIPERHFCFILQP